MDILNRYHTRPVNRPIKVLQFGEGNFLRGFVDYMIDIANEKGTFDGNIAIVKPISYGSLESFHVQDCQYGVSLRGLENGEPKVINRAVTSVCEAVCAYEDYEAYMGLSRLESLRFIVSNTTEAGIVYDEGDLFEEKPPRSYPGKLTKFLYDRYLFFKGDMSKGLIILPCELIENNATALKECVNKLAEGWGLGEGFINWVNEGCVFCNTLVDRIITGFPHDEAEEYWQRSGYEDRLLVCGELFALWVIEDKAGMAKEFPLDKAGLPVIFTDDIRPYRKQKVRILNGAHTSLVAASFLSGNDTVKESMDDELINKFVKSLIFDEIIPNLTLPRRDLEDFAYKVIERFKNPFIKHSLLSISLNSVSKWKARCLPSFKDYYAANGRIPACLTFSLAALISLYRDKKLNGEALVGYRDGKEYKIMDDAGVMVFFDGANNMDSRLLAEEVLKKEDFFGEDMTSYPGLVEAVGNYLEQIKGKGMRKTLEAYIKA